LVKILKFFDADLGLEKFGRGNRDKHHRFATLAVKNKRYRYTDIVKDKQETHKGYRYLKKYWAAYQSLGAPLLVGDEGNVPAVLLNVHFELRGEHLLDVLPGDGVSQA
jgi:hypothetical protein